MGDLFFFLISNDFTYFFSVHVNFFNFCFKLKILKKLPKNNNFLINIRLTYSFFNFKWLYIFFWIHVNFFNFFFKFLKFLKNNWQKKVIIRKIIGWPILFLISNDFTYFFEFMLIFSIFSLSFWKFWKTIGKKK